MGKKTKRWVENPTDVVVDFDAASKSRDRQERYCPMPAFLGGSLKSPDSRTRLKALKIKKKMWTSKQWRQLRYLVLKTYGPRCMCCGITRDHGAIIHVDHIKPVSRFPELAMVFDNLQVLCEDCNLGKSNLDDTDWRKR